MTDPFTDRNARLPSLPRVRRPVDISDASRFPNINAAIAAGRADPVRWDALQEEFDRG